jgi:hypothetical protein
MAYRLVRGEFILFYKGKTNQTVGSEPDGDTVWFKPDKPALLKNFNLADPANPRDADFKGGGQVSLRFEAIDALELHYIGTQQEDQGARGARNFLLKEMGFQSVTYSGAHQTTVKTASPHPVKGYILTRSIDPFGRPVSFAYLGTTNRQDGSNVFLDVPLLNKSLNAGLAKAGQVFPTFYDGLPTDLRNRVTDLVNQAWNADRGLWPRDVSTAGFTVKNLSELTSLVFWPKLFRRLADYFSDGNQGLAQFDAWLRQFLNNPNKNRDDELWIAPIAEKGNMHDVIEISGNTISMKYWPEELIIRPR